MTKEQVEKLTKISQELTILEHDLRAVKNFYAAVKVFDSRFHITELLTTIKGVTKS